MATTKVECAPHNRNLMETAWGKACESPDQYRCVFEKVDKSLRARMVALGNIWYATIASELGDPIPEVKSFCKYTQGLRLKEIEDPLQGEIMRYLLKKYAPDYRVDEFPDKELHERKIMFIGDHPEWFPVFEKNNGLSVEGCSRYLHWMQWYFGQQNIYLASNKEQDLLSYYQQMEKQALTELAKQSSGATDG